MTENWTGVVNADEFTVNQYVQRRFDPLAKCLTPVVFHKCV